MEPISIQVTYRRGKPFAAYIHLGGSPGEKSVRSEEVAPELIADYGADGRVLGVEVVSPGATTADEILEVFDTLGLVRPTADDLGPLVAAYQCSTLQVGGLPWPRLSVRRHQRGTIPASERHRPCASRAPIHRGNSDASSG